MANEHFTRKQARERINELEKALEMCIEAIESVDMDELGYYVEQQNKAEAIKIPIKQELLSKVRPLLSEGNE